MAEHGRDLLGHLTRQAIRRGTFADVTELQTAIRTYIDSYNERAKPFSWTNTADELINKIKRKSINTQILVLRSTHTLVNESR